MIFFLFKKEGRTGHEERGEDEDTKKGWRSSEVHDNHDLF